MYEHSTSLIAVLDKICVANITPLMNFMCGLLHHKVLAVT